MVAMDAAGRSQTRRGEPDTEMSLAERYGNEEMQSKKIEGTEQLRFTKVERNVLKSGVPHTTNSYNPDPQVADYKDAEEVMTFWIYGGDV